MAPKAPGLQKHLRILQRCEDKQQGFKIKCNTVRSLFQVQPRFLDKLFLNYEKIMVKNVLLTQENMELRSANEKQSQRRKRKSTYIPHGGAAQRVRTDKGDDKDSTQINAENSARGNDRNSIQVAAEDSIQRNDGEYTQEANNPVRRKRAPNRCSVCRALEHTARNCPRLG
ncbi:hypothetical protein ACJ73_08562 [Blastomyces percursus]|uniref:Uncharacterized protein n=1 Tax=Blastomyces percursus TaxID=1658174 RepID=A0A1J9QIT0_9EURO|nr:hypothetical protein ACJ73_08562 [Blastomyces percursus]